jgi:hypothetical protein
LLINKSEKEALEGPICASISSLSLPAPQPKSFNIVSAFFLSSSLVILDNVSALTTAPSV